MECPQIVKFAAQQRLHQFGLFRWNRPGKWPNARRHDAHGQTRG